MRKMQTMILCAGMHLLLCGCQNGEMVSDARRESLYAPPRTIGTNLLGPSSESYDARNSYQLLGGNP